MKIRAGKMVGKVGFEPTKNAGVKDQWLKPDLPTSLNIKMVRVAGHAPAYFGLQNRSTPISGFTL